jgi:triosephosphate isomerase
MTTKVPWIGTSWKMNKVRAEARAFAEAVAGSGLSRSEAVRLFVIPPFMAVADVAAILAGTRVAVGVQNMHWAEAGAWTGEVSPLMVADAGATLVEIGHSERRTHFGETDATVALKTATAVRHGLTALVCVGDTRAEFEAKRTAEVLRTQVAAAVSKVPEQDLGRVVIAYEPVWSIGEGGTPAEPGFANEQHALIKAFLRETIGTVLPVLYGGSVNPRNCCALAGQADIDGLFIGRSAWNPEGYLGIVDSVMRSLNGRVS